MCIPVRQAFVILQHEARITTPDIPKSPSVSQAQARISCSVHVPVRQAFIISQHKARITTLAMLFCHALKHAVCVLLTGTAQHHNLSTARKCDLRSTTPVCFLALDMRLQP